MNPANFQPPNPHFHWAPMLPPDPPPCGVFWNTNNIADQLKELQDTLNLAKSMEKELEALRMIKDAKGSMETVEQGSGVECLRYLEALKMDLGQQEILSVEAANSLMYTLRAQLEPFRFVVDENSPWEEKSAAVRLTCKMKKSKRNKLWKKRKRRCVAEMRAKESERFEQANREADEWREKEMAKDMANIKVDEMKAIEKVKARRERRRLEPELELALIVEEMQELRSLRIEKLKKQGHFLPEEDDKFFESVRAAVEQEENQTTQSLTNKETGETVIASEEDTTLTTSNKINKTQTKTHTKKAIVFVNGQLQLSIFEIVNVIGTGIRSIGFWTEKNGLVKRLDQQPQSMSALSTWKDHLKHIIWPGEADSVPKGWEIPTNGKKLRIGVPKRTGYTDLVKVTRDPITNTPRVTGFCIDFFEAVIQAMPYDVSYELIPFEKPNGKPAGNYNDLVHQVYLGRYDAVVGDTTILANRSSYVDFTFPFIKSGVGLIVPMKDQVKLDSISFLKPLSWKLWLTSFVSFFLIGCTVWVLEHRINPDFRGPANYQASTIFWFAFSTMVFAPRERVFSFGARVLVITWYFIVLVLTQSYTASLASLLTSQQLHPTITSMSSLLEKAEKVGYQRTSFILGKLKETGFSQSSLVPFDTAEECDELLRKGRENAKGGISAAFLEIPYLRLFLGQYCNTYKMVEEPFNIDGFGFVFPIGSPLVADVSRAILKVAESPKAMELERAWFKKKDESCPDPNTNPDPNPSITSRQLGVDSFWLLFLVTFVMCVLTLGKFTFVFLKKTKVNELWKEFHQPDKDSYINNVEKCPCSSSRHMPENINQATNQIDNC